MQDYCKLDPWENVHENLTQNTTIFCCEVVAILFQPQCARGQDHHALFHCASEVLIFHFNEDDSLYVICSLKYLSFMNPHVNIKQSTSIHPYFTTFCVTSAVLFINSWEI